MDSLETITSIMALKIRYPNSIYLLIGSEEETINTSSSLASDC